MDEPEKLTSNGYCIRAVLNNPKVKGGRGVLVQITVLLIEH